MNGSCCSTYLRTFARIVEIPLLSAICTPRLLQFLENINEKKKTINFYVNSFYSFVENLLRAFIVSHVYMKRCHCSSLLWFLPILFRHFYEIDFGESCLFFVHVRLNDVVNATQFARLLFTTARNPKMVNTKSHPVYILKWQLHLAVTHKRFKMALPCMGQTPHNWISKIKVSSPHNLWILRKLFLNYEQFLFKWNVLHFRLGKEANSLMETQILAKKTICLDS